MTLSLQDWKKKKAKTLLGETVTKALTATVAAQKALRDNTNAPNLKQLTTYSGAARDLQIQIVKTRAMCKKGIHDQTARLLEQMEQDAKRLYLDSQDMQKEFNDFLRTYKANRDAVIQALESVEKSQLPATVAKAQQVVHKGIMFGQTAQKQFLSDEIQALINQFGSAENILKEIAAKQAARQPAVAGGRALPATPADLARQLSEVTLLIRKLNVPGGYYGPYWTKKFSTLDLV